MSAGVTQATFDVSGAAGEATATIAVTPGDTLQVNVGGGGGSGFGPAGVVFHSGVRAGNGLVTITYIAPDTDLALANVPSNLTVTATGPSGAAVTYTPPTVVDANATTPAVSCDHPSGSTFAIGTTTVTCTVTDADDSPSTVSASFTVTVVPDLRLALSVTPSTATTGSVVTASASLTNIRAVSRTVTRAAPSAT